MLAPLQELRAKLAPEAVDVTYELFLSAEAACGSGEAIPILAQRLRAKQSELKIDTASGYAYLSSWDRRQKPYTMRDWMLWQLTEPSPYYSWTAPLAVRDTIARAALEAEELDDWWVLYLLGHISDPQAQDKERLMEVWDRNTGPIRVVAADLLYVWGDSETLVQLYDQTEEAEVQTEIAWALGELGTWEPTEEAVH